MMVVTHAFSNTRQTRRRSTNIASDYATQNVSVSMNGIFGIFLLNVNVWVIELMIKPKSFPFRRCPLSVLRSDLLEQWTVLENRPYDHGDVALLLRDRKTMTSSCNIRRHNSR